ncbi:MAG TPA: alpha-amylase family glycosyl hydrolase [Bacteroidota bacterium]|nr:alpha-amylase family glycosyl hydrolase [Bacteroidota bacterium]
MNPNRFVPLIVFSFFAVDLLSQTSADSVTVTFRAHKPSTSLLFVPGEFNSWGPNTNGVISNGAASQMIFDAPLNAWTKTYTFKIHAVGRQSPSLGDSALQYKFNDGGCSTCWYSDPLNPETNAADNNNSVLRLSRLFFFEYFPTLNASNQIIRITIGLFHANSDSITSIKLSTGQSAVDSLSTIDVTGNYDRAIRILDAVLPSPIPRLYYVRLVAHNNRGDSVVYSTGGIVVPSMPLPSYAKHGVTLPTQISGDSVTFRLRVPGKQYVLLRYAPLGQDPALASPVVLRKADSVNWWINLKLPNNTYEYLYELDDGRRIYDPWGRWNGDRGSRFTVGQAGLTADDYVWKSISYQRPPLEKLVIYELNVGEFTGGFLNKSAGQGTLRDLMPLLVYFDTLGVNALELMPITDYGNVGRSGFSWGYDSNSLFAIEPAYGTPADLKTLVDSAHALGIAVILDVVFNHLNDTSPLWSMLPDEGANPYFKAAGDWRYNEDQLIFFKDIDHWTEETQEIVYEALRMWIDVYKIDGFRYDYTQGIGWKIDEPNKGILGWTNRIAQEYGNSIYQIAEHLPESPALIYYSGLTSGWADAFHDEILNKESYNESARLIDIENLVIDLGSYPGNDTPSQPSTYGSRTEPVKATVNHDEQSLLIQMERYAPRLVTVAEALQRDKLYATLMFTSLGIPMLWQGMEFSEPRGWLSEGERLSYRPVQPSYLGQERGISHYNYYRTLIRQRTHNPALFRGTLKKLLRSDPNKSLVWGFVDSTSGAKVMCFANFTGNQRTLSNVPWLGTGTWYDVFDETPLTISDTMVSSFAIPPYTAKIYSNMSNAMLGLPTGVPGMASKIPTMFTLHQNYPNPFNPSTTFEFEIPNRTFASLKIYNLLGEEVAVLREGWVEPGRHQANWDALTARGTRAASGVYFARLQTNEVQIVKKIMLLK